MTRDILFIAGLTLVGVGCWQVSTWLACIVVGVIVSGMSLIGHLRDRPIEPETKGKPDDS